MTFQRFVEETRNKIAIRLYKKLGEMDPIPENEERKIATAEEKLFSFTFHDLPISTFTSTTYNFVVTQLLKEAAIKIRETAGTRHIWIQRIIGELAIDDEARTFEGEKMTLMTLYVYTVLWNEE